MEYIMRKIFPSLLITCSLLLSACSSIGEKSTPAAPPPTSSSGNTSNTSNISERIASLANNNTPQPTSISARRPSSGSNGLPLAQYLSSGRQDIVQTFCSPNSPNHVASMGTGQKCQSKVHKLFDYCTKQELNGILADPITNKQEADTTAIVVFDCIFANHTGPEAVAQFRDTLNKAIQKKISLNQ